MSPAIIGPGVGSNDHTIVITCPKCGNNIFVRLSSKQVSGKCPGCRKSFKLTVKGELLPQGQPVLIDARNVV